MEFHFQYGETRRATATVAETTRRVHNLQDDAAFVAERGNKCNGEAAIYNVIRVRFAPPNAGCSPMRHLTKGRNNTPEKVKRRLPSAGAAVATRISPRKLAFLSPGDDLNLPG